MNNKLALVLLSGALLAAPGSPVIHQPGAQTRQASAVRNMDITGEIARSDYGYIIRGKVPAEIFTILNPVPRTLDGLVRSGKIVRIKVKIISGDNVEIETIEGKQYNGRRSRGK